MTIDEFVSQGWTAENIVIETETGMTVDVVAATGVYTRAAGDFRTTVFVGDSVTWSGFAAGGNNGEKTVSAVTELTVTTSDIAGLVNVTNDAGTSYIVTDKLVQTGRYLVGRVHSVTAAKTVNLVDGTTTKWATILSATPLDVGSTPIRMSTSIRLVSAADIASLNILYKRV